MRDRVCYSSHFLSVRAAQQALHSFPTRRSSDLLWQLREQFEGAVITVRRPSAGNVFWRRWLSPLWRLRSEEHTSELQSRRDVVCRLLLEKKKLLTGVNSALCAPIFVRGRSGGSF